MLWIIGIILVGTMMSAKGQNRLDQGICSREICKCQGKEVICDGNKGEEQGQEEEMLIQREQITEGIRRMEMRNIKGRIRFKTGSVLVPSGTRIDIIMERVGQMVLEAKAAQITTPSSAIHLNVSNVEKISFQNGAISAENGQFVLNVREAKEVKISGRSFGVLQRASFSNVDLLHLAPSAFKPNSMQWKADLEIEMSQCKINSLATNCFSSARSIVLRDSKIREIDSGAFSGFQIEKVAFEGCTIDKVQSQAFPEQVVIGKLSFANSTLTSLAEDAIMSGITNLEINFTDIKAMSTGALNTPVAKVHFFGNVFHTLSARALKFQTWNRVTIERNQFKFFEQSALAGISKPAQEANNIFTFKDNEILYTNHEALKLEVPAAGVVLDVSRNVFGQECSCEFMDWIDIVVGKQSLDVADLRSAIKNTSFCRVHEYYQQCFRESNKVLVTDYLDKVCFNFAGEEAECLAEKLDIWRIFKDQIEIETNKGILLVILLFAVAFALLLCIYTLLRWIVYTLQVRVRVKNEDEWNFTKIEERREAQQQSPCPTVDHYERLPLTKEEGSMGTQQSNLKEEEKEDHSQRGTASGATATSTTKRNSKYLHDQPKLTFYDEMIDLLSSKLEDPDNYATVADSTSGANRKASEVKDELYIDPNASSKDS